MMEAQEAARALEGLGGYLRSLGSVAVAFSGGVDSTFLLKVAHDALGGGAVAVTARSATFPRRELEAAEAFCRAEGIRHIVCDSEELDIPGFDRNPVNRCYLCKRELFGKILRIAADEGLAAVCEGSNMDDTGDYRPGLQAVAELGIKSPLRRCGLYKKDIRGLSRALGLPTWNKQAFACLSSRFVYGEAISPQKLSMVDRAEQLLLDRGFGQVRVRIHGDKDFIARIEVAPHELVRLAQEHEAVAAAFRDYGFAYVTMDLGGYRTGSMNVFQP